MIFLRYGANYIPSKHWLYSWLDFDELSIREDIKALKNLGFDHVRAHILWSIFQPNEGYVSPHCLENLAKFTNICEEEKMDFFLSVFTGWMSGMVFLPPWLNVGGFDVMKKGMFTNEAAISAEKYLIEKLAEVVGKSAAFLGFDLGNELNCLTRREIDSDITKENVVRWGEIMLEKCEEAAPGKMHVNGLAHSPWFGDTFFTREHLANTGAMLPIHAWAPFTGTVGRYGWDSYETAAISNYMFEMARAYTDEDEKRLYTVQEFGITDMGLDDEKIEKFIVRTLDSVRSEKNVWGITWWCSHDIVGQYIGFEKFEHYLGLLDTENKPKKAAQVFEKYIKEEKSRPIEEIERDAALIIKKGPGDENDYTNAERFMEYFKNGIHVAFVREDKAEDGEYLAKRGIKKIIRD